MSLQLGIGAQDFGFEVNNGVQDRKDSNISCGQLAAKMITLQELLKESEMVGDTAFPGIFPCFGLVVGILSLGEDVVNIAVFFQQHFRDGEIGIGVALKATLSGNITSNGQALSDLHISINQIRKLPKRGLCFQRPGPFNLRNMLVLLVRDFEKKSDEVASRFDIPVIKFGNGHFKTEDGETPFGQLPYLIDGNVKIGQSLAIARYVSRKGGLQGDTDADFAISEQLLEEHGDIYNVLAKAQYADNKPEAWKNAWETSIPNHLGFLEKILNGDHFGSKLTAGDVAVFSILNTIIDLKPEILKNYPKLQAHYTRFATNPLLAKYLGSGIGIYFKPQ